jgi:predicted metal-dependent peptidase
MSIDQARIDKFDRDFKIISFAFAKSFSFWNVIAERCEFSITDDDSWIPTAAMTPSGKAIFNINFYETLSQKQFLFIVAHELCHFIFEHFPRMGNRIPQVWNMATDYAINLMLKYQFDNDEYIVKDILLDAKYEGWSAYKIYDDLMDNEIKEFSFADLISDEDADGKETVTIRERRVPRPEREKGESSESYRQRISEWMKQTMCEAATLAKSQGNMPAGMEREINKFLKPKVNWLEAIRQKLRQGATRGVPRDSSWTTPNRRFLGESYIIPASVGPDAPTIGFALDTSGSMSQEELEQGLAELDEIRRQFRAKVYLMDCDCDVYNFKWISPYEPLPKMKGGGGTDFAPIFKHLIDNRIKIDDCIVFTDGEGNFGNDPTRHFDVLWVLTNNRVEPPFGDVIRISGDNYSE